MIIIDETQIKEIYYELFSSDLPSSGAELLDQLGIFQQDLDFSFPDMRHQLRDLNPISSLALLLGTEVDYNVLLLEKLISQGKLPQFLKKYANQGPLVFQNRSLACYDVSQKITERVFVETGFDTDGSGYNDLVEVYIRRPCETAFGMKTPVIYVANPYMMSCNEEVYESHLHPVNQWPFPEEPGDSEEAWNCPQAKKSFCPQGMLESNPWEEPEFEAFSDFYDYYSSRGYSLVFYTGRGTLHSDGINITGSKLELEAAASVLDWLSGNKKAYSQRDGLWEIKAHWCNGSVGMSGKSYLGTLCIGVATLGKENLKTIVPEAAISNWYEYYRGNGIPVCPLGYQGDDVDLLSWYCQSALKSHPSSQWMALWNKHLQKVRFQMDRCSGNYNSFWEERNYLKSADKIRCSILLVHGINDWNVKTTQFHDLWEATRNCGIHRNLLLHRGEHIYIYNLMEYNFALRIHQWFDYWLLGVGKENFLKKNTVVIQDNLNPRLWREYADWNQGDSRRFHIDENLALTGEPGIRSSNLSVFTDSLLANGYDYALDNQEHWLNSLIHQNSKNNSLQFQSLPFRENRIVSGAFSVEFEAAFDKHQGIISAMLVDLGHDIRLDETPQKVGQSGFHLGYNGKRMDLVAFQFQQEPSQYKVITRGWMNIENRESIFQKTSIQPGEFYTFRIHMVPTDHQIKQGHRLALIIYGQDAQYTPRWESLLKISIRNSSLQLILPDV